MTNNQSEATFIVKPSINMLPIQEIIEVLDGAIESSDTQHVAGIPATSIAIGVEGDRHTVRNTEHLGGRPASDYLTTDINPSEDIEKLADKYEKETAGLRLELYRLYEILNKQLGASYKPESGYLEDFVEAITLHVPARVVNAGSFISELHVDQEGFATAKEYIVVDDGAHAYIARISDTMNQVYMLEGAIASAAREVTLYKIKGEMLKNTYSFSETINNVLEENPHSVLLGDYADSQMLELGNGLGTNIKLRGNMFAIDGHREIAVLDSIRAYVMRNTLESASEISCKVYLIESYEEDKPMLKLIGTSMSQNIFESQWATFKIKSDGEALEVLEGQEVLIAFECNSDNAYKIKMGTGQNGDLHTNRSLYMRNKEEESYYKANSTFDILLGLNFNGYVATTTTPHTDGLYTSKTFVNEREDNCIAQLQLKLKNINMTSVQSHLPVDGYSGFVVDRQILGTGKMVVGNNIATFSRSNSHTFYTDEHIAVYPGDSVYFIPVKAQMVSHSELFEGHDVHEVIEMSPVRIVGDYLVFECRLPNHVKHFEAQVFYEDTSNLKAAALESVIVSLL